MQRRALRRIDIRVEPLLTEIVSRLRCWALLVERAPIAWDLRRLLPREKARIAVVVVPQPLAGLATKRIVWFGLGRQGKHMPMLTTGSHFGKDATR